MATQEQAKSVPILGVAWDRDIQPLIEEIIGVPQCAGQESIYVVPDVDTTLDLLTRKELPVPDLLIINYDKQPNFHSLLTQLRGEDSLYRDVPIILMSAYDVGKVAVQCEQYNIETIFGLPIDIDTFCGEISRLLFDDE